MVMYESDSNVIVCFVDGSPLRLFLIEEGFLQYESEFFFDFFDVLLDFCKIILMRGLFCKKNPFIIESSPRLAELQFPAALHCHNLRFVVRGHLVVLERQPSNYKILRPPWCEGETFIEHILSRNPRQPFLQRPVSLAQRAVITATMSIRLLDYEHELISMRSLQRLVFKNLNHDQHSVSGVEQNRVHFVTSPALVTILGVSLVADCQVNHLVSHYFWRVYFHDAYPFL